MIPLMLELETPGMVMKPLDSHHCHAQHPAVTAVALVILVPAEPAFVLVATSSIRFAAVPASTALAAKLKGADLIASSDRVSHPLSHLNMRILAKEAVTKLQTPPENFRRRSSQVTRTSVGCHPCRRCLSAQRTLCLSLPTRRSTIEPAQDGELFNKLPSKNG